MASWLAWLLPVPLATVAAVVYASWASRVRGPDEAIDSVAEYDRFRCALSAPIPAPRVQPASRPATERVSR